MRRIPRNIKTRRMNMATTFSELWAEMKTEALNIWQSVKAEAVTLEHNLVPAIESDLVTVLSQFKGVALNTVMSLAGAEFANLTGTQKNAITVNTIVQTALATGKAVALQDAQLLAQQAYNGLTTTVDSVK
jgi:hypothetical protein